MKSVINNETLPQAMWDEENRLKHVYDENTTLSSYLYDAGGERTLKLWDGYQYMMINGQQQIGFFDITDYTLYTSPYMVLTPEQYTKHYYAESDRIVSKIGGGMQNNIHQIDEIVTGFNIQDHGGYHQKSNQLMEMFDRDYNQLNVQADVNAHFEYWLNDAINHDEYEEMIFFYHKDLPKAFGMGSSTQISDPGANIIQHIEYLPYGELFFERRDYWNTPYKFNAKELDQETGLYYYGARYYTPEVSIWLSVDPLADKYPSMSPYMYCAGNPVVLIDPNGMEIEGFSIDDNGDVQVDYETASKDAIEIYNAMSMTETGSESFKEMISKETNITLVLTDGVLLDESGNQIHGLTQGDENDLNEHGEYKEATITISTADINSNPNDRYNGFSNKEKINGIGTHESVHLNKKQIKLDFSNKSERRIEQAPVMKEYKSRLEFINKYGTPSDRDIKPNYEGYLFKKNLPK